MVLILVVVDYGLVRIHLTTLLMKLCKVLILVLLDDGLVRSGMIHKVVKVRVS